MQNNTKLGELFNKLKEEIKPLNIHSYGLTRFQIIHEGYILIIQELKNGNLIGTWNDILIMESTDINSICENIKEWIYFINN